MEDKSEREMTKVDVDQNELETSNDMATDYGCNVIEETGKHKKKKKKKERKDDLPELSVEVMGQKLEGVENDLSSKDSKDECKTLKVDQSVLELIENLPTGACQATEESTKHKKKKKDKKGKHESREQSNNLKSGSVETQKQESDFSFEQKSGDEKIEELKVDTNKAETSHKTPSSSCEVTEQSGHHKKKKKEKKRKHESSFLPKNMEQKTDGEKMEKIDVDKNENGVKKDMSASKVAEKSGCEKKAKKRKDVSDGLIENVKQKPDGEKVEINVEKNEAVTSNDTPTKGDEVTEELIDRTKKEKQKRHESDVPVENMKQKTDGEKMEKIDLENENGIRNEISASSCEVTDESILTKKIKNWEHKSDLSDESVEHKTGSERIAVNVDKNKAGTNKEMLTSSCEVTMDSGHKKKKKDKKWKHEIESSDNIEQKTVTEKMEINVEKNEKAGTNKDMTTKSVEVTEDSGHKKKKKKKEKKQKHNIESCDNVEQETVADAMEINVEKDEAGMNKDMATQSAEVTEDSGHKKKKKEKKQKHEIESCDNLKQKTVTEEMEINVEKNEVVTNKDMATKSSEVKEDSGHKKKKKEKKRKHEIESCDKAEQKTCTEEMEISVGKNEAGMSKDMTTKSSEVPEDSGHKKRDKKKKHEIESCDNVEQKNVTEGIKTNVGKNEAGTNKDMATKSREVTEDSDHKKKKKEKKRKHEIELSDEVKQKPVTEETGINVEKNEAGTNEDMATNTCEVTEDSDHKKKKKEKKRKHEIELSDEVKQKPVTEETGINVEKNEAGTNEDMATNTCEVTEDSDHKKKKKEKKRKHEIELSDEVKQKPVTEETGINVEKNEAGTNEDMATNTCEVTEDSGHKKKKKKRERKRKHEIESCDNVEQTSKDMATKSSEITEDSGHTKKDKKRKHEIDIESYDNVDQNTDSDREVTEESSHKKKKNEKRLRHKKELSLENVEKETDGNRTQTDHGEKDKFINDAGMNKDIATSGSDVIESKVEETSKPFEKSEKSDVSKNKKVDDQVGGNQWKNAEFSSVEKKEKFLRLMGAYKSSSKPQGKSNYSAMAMNRKEENAFVHSLEKQYFQSTQKGKEKGVGLGYH